MTETDELIVSVSGSYSELRVQRLVFTTTANRKIELGANTWNGTRFDYKCPAGHAVVGFFGSFGSTSRPLTHTRARVASLLCSIAVLAGCRVGADNGLRSIGFHHMRTAPWKVPNATADIKSAAN